MHRGVLSAGASPLERPPGVEIHDHGIDLAAAEYGILSLGGLESAVYAAKNKYLYEKEGDLFDFAAVYLVRIAKAHAFQNGNSGRRTPLRSRFLM